jgi:hypothetical protein
VLYRVSGEQSLPGALVTMFQGGPAVSEPRTWLLLEHRSGDKGAERKRVCEGGCGVSEGRRGKERAKETEP